MDATRTKKQRSWHSRQARIVRARHPLETSKGFSWAEFCEANHATQDNSPGEAPTAQEAGLVAWLETSAVITLEQNQSRCNRILEPRFPAVAWLFPFN